MLYNASDYKFVNTSQLANKIHGNILPIVNPTSQTAQLYLENYLFMLEAYHERMHPESKGNNDVVADISLSGRNLYALNLNSQSLSVGNATIAGPILGYDNDVTYYVSPDTTHPQSHVNTGYTEDSTYYIYSFLQNWINPCPELKSPYYAMRPYANPSRLLSEFIRVKFWAFQHMRKLLIGLRLGDFATRVVIQTLKPDGSVDYESETNLRNTSVSYIRGYSTTSDGQGHTIEYQLFRTNAAYKAAFFTFPYATTAQLIWKCSVSRMGGDSSENTKYVWGTKQLSITNGAIKVPNDMFEMMADDAISISGKESNSTISYYGAYLLVDFEFPARLNGISWNWQPTYT